MSAKINIVGLQFERLYVFAEAPSLQSPCGKISRSWVRCQCGKELMVRNSSLRHGHTKSCGCFQKEAGNASRYRHGHSINNGSRTYRSWEHMKDRCENPKCKDYHRYGAIGVQVCERWQKSFEAFLADMGESPAGLTIDRYPDKNGNYEPGNCRWATYTEQNRNRRDNRNFTVLEFSGCLSAVSSHFGIDRRTVAARLKLGWPTELAFTKPSLRKLAADR